MKKLRKTKGPERKERLTPEKIEEIVTILDGWTEKITWDALRDELERRWHYTYSRVALPKHPRLKQAFEFCKERQRKSPPIPRHGDIHLQKALERIAFLEAQNDRLQHENNRLLEQFVRWSYNADLKGLDEQYLNTPLFPINRRKSDPSKHSK